MDERLRRDNSENKENLNSNSSREHDFQQWNYSDNINSNFSAEKINPSVKMPGRFELHIP